MSTDKNCISHWFPLLQSSGVPVPKTVIIHAHGSKWTRDPDWDEIDPELVNSELVELIIKAAHVVESDANNPVFLRTGHGSGKHDWVNTCFLPKLTEDVIAQHVAALCNWCDQVDMIGLPTKVWAVREMLKTAPAFIAFKGFPVTKERRYFFRDGKVLGHHPYWIPDSIKNPRRIGETIMQARTRHGLNPVDYLHTNLLTEYATALDALNAQSPEEIAELTALTQQAAAPFAGTGAWSLDWLHTTDRGWVAIDMAEAHRSFCWHDHPTAPSKEGLSA